MKTTNVERGKAGTALYGSFPSKKGAYWNARRRFVARGHFEATNFMK